jgi:hypothetical protein
MRLSSNKGYIQGEDLRLIDRHDTWMGSEREWTTDQY